MRDHFMIGGDRCDLSFWVLEVLWLPKEVCSIRSHSKNQVLCSTMFNQGTIIYEYIIVYYINDYKL